VASSEDEDEAALELGEVGDGDACSTHHLEA